ncbi:hypothetical protein [Actinoallomurus sp. NPDC050550]|uniref:hypothetical protein n=1 Tax=Actinoallomurus sp. NPDC050550 TaxID=3154937 RepID=UPI0033E5D0E6
MLWDASDFGAISTPLELHRKLVGSAAAERGTVADGFPAARAEPGASVTTMAARTAASTGTALRSRRGRMRRFMTSYLSMVSPVRHLERHAKSRMRTQAGV